MPKQRKSFRLRLPWLASKRTKAQPQRPLPTKESTQPQPITSTPIKRPAFRPTGVAPTQPRSSHQRPAKIEPQSSRPSSSSSASESTKTSTTKATKPPSPSPATILYPKITSQPTSSSGATIEPPSPSSAAKDEQKDTSQSSSSPSSTTIKPPKANSQTSSPSSAATESQKEASRSSFSPSSATTKPPFSLAASESPKAASKIASYEMAIMPSPSPLASQKTASELEPKPAFLDKSQAIGQDNSSASLASTHTQESTPQTSLQDTEAIQEISKDKGTYKEEPMQKTIIEAPGTRRDAKETYNVARKASRRKRKQETVERKKTKATTCYIGKKIKTVIPLQPMEEDTSTSFPKPSLSPPEEEAPRQRETTEDISKLVLKLSAGPLFIEKPVTIIALAGENNGASMQLSSEVEKKDGSVHIHGNYKTDPDESPETAIYGELRTKCKIFKDKMASTSTAYVNSNVQNVNDSIVFV